MSVQSQIYHVQVRNAFLVFPSQKFGLSEISLSEILRNLPLRTDNVFKEILVRVSLGGYSSVCQLFSVSSRLFKGFYYLLSALLKEWNILKQEIMIQQ